MIHPPGKLRNANTFGSGSPTNGLEQRLWLRLLALRRPIDATLVVGFSGGTDSLCLAAALGKISARGQFHVQLVHVDHGIRGAASAVDALKAQRLAAELGLPITVKKLSADLHGRSVGIGLEEAGRRERFLAFRDTCEEMGTDFVALGHHRLDQAETVLLHLFRGAGLRGAAGMSALTSLPVPWWRESDQRLLTVWRPMLGESRATIDGYVHALGLEPIEDRSNADARFLRNWLRHDLMPLLDERLPGASAGLARFAEIAGQEDAIIEAIAAAIVSRATTGSGGLNWSQLADQPLAIQRRVVQRWLTLAAPFQEIGFERVEAVLASAELKRQERHIELGGPVIAAWAGDTVFAGSRDSVHERLRASFQGPLAPSFFVPTRLQSGDAVEIDGWRMTATGEGPLLLRAVRTGDRFVDSNQPVREWARRNGLHALLRDRLLVVASPEGVLWAVGQEIAMPPGASTNGKSRFALSEIEETA